MAKWINHFDKKPKDGEEILAYGQYEGEIYGFGENIQGIGIYHNGTVSLSCDGYYAHIHVKYWQKKPKDPVFEN